jgi:cytoskeletal protein RodZ
MTSPGWYPDPYGTSQLRYWDGATWTEHLGPVAQSPPTSAPYVASAPVAPPWYKRKVTIAVSSVVALLVVFGVIGAAAGSPKTKKASPTTADLSAPTSQAVPLVHVTQATTSAAAALASSPSAVAPPSPVVTTSSAPPPAPVSVAQTTKPVKVTTAAPKAPAPVTSAPPPAPAEQTFANCKAMNQVYPHGVGRAGAVDHVSGSSKPVTDFYVDTALYDANESHDADGDGIACEKD